MEIIDSHCHIYPHKIASKAVEAIGKFYDIDMHCNGTSEDLILRLKKFGVSRAVVHSTATKPEQVVSINDFIIETVKTYPQFIGYGTMHPDFLNIEEEILRIINAGLKGIKIHPDFQMRNIDDEKMYKIYDVVSDKIPILFHIGDVTKDYSNPLRLKKVLKDFPKLKTIAAHMGGYRVWEESKDILKGENVWVDTSSSFKFIKDDFILELINHYGEDRVLFATDYPMWDFSDEYTRLMSLGLKNSTLEKIFSKNIKELLKI